MNNRLSFLLVMLAIALTAKIAQISHAHATPPKTETKKLNIDEACATPQSSDLKKVCDEYHEAMSIMKGERGFEPMFGLHVFANFNLRPAKGGPTVHDSLSLNNSCRAEAGAYTLIGFSGDHQMALLERMGEREGKDACARGTRFFIPVEWIKPAGQKVSQK